MRNKALRIAIFNDYLRDYSLEVGLSPATVSSKNGSLRRFLDWLGDKQLNLDNCLNWVKSLHDNGLQPESVKHEVRVIRATIRFLYKRHFIKSDFAPEIPSPKISRKQLEIVPAETAEKVIIAGTESGPGDNCLNSGRKNEHRQALKFVLRTGLRSRELLDLRGLDFNLEDETFFVNSKSGKLDSLPIPVDMLSELARRVNLDRVFQVTRETLNNSLKRGCRLLNIDKRIRTHTLRHIFCTTLLKKGVPLQKVSRLMRHSSVMITDSVYSHYSIEDLKLALNANHPLILQGVGSTDFFNTIVELIKAAGVVDDNRFNTLIKQTNDKLSVIIKRI